MKIRLVQKSDYQDVVELYNVFVGSDRYSQHDNGFFQKFLKNNTNFIFVATDNDKIVGFATFSLRGVVRHRLFNVIILKRKPKGKEVTKEEKENNKRISPSGYKLNIPFRP